MMVRKDDDDDKDVLLLLLLLLMMMMMMLMLLLVLAMMKIMVMPESLLPLSHLQVDERHPSGVALQALLLHAAHAALQQPPPVLHVGLRLGQVQAHQALVLPQRLTC
jgi:hypothetical protein